MPAPIQVLIAEPFASQRRMIEDAANAQSDMHVCGSVENGRAAIELLRKSPVDVVILNVDLAVPDGPQTVKAIRELDANVPIVLFSTASVRGGEITLKALSAGASDFIARPSQMAGSTLKTFLETQLLAAIRTWHARASFRGINTDALQRLKARFADAARPEDARGNPASAEPDLASNPNRPQQPAVTSRPPLSSPQIIVIGSSTGGPNALCDVLSGLRHPLAVPVLIVQHMPPKFTRFLAERLDSKTSFKVREAIDGDVVTADTVLVAPGGLHMAVVKNGSRVVIELNDKAPVNSCRPAVDVLFQSVVKLFGGRTLGVILTGMGADGTVGCRHIKQAGGQVIAQHRDSCVVWGMPRSVEEAGLADIVAPLDQIPAKIQNMLKPSNAASPKRPLVNA